MLVPKTLHYHWLIYLIIWSNQVGRQAPCACTIKCGQVTKEPKATNEIHCRSTYMSKIVLNCISPTFCWFTSLSTPPMSRNHIARLSELYSELYYYIDMCFRFSWWFRDGPIKISSSEESIFSHRYPDCNFILLLATRY